MEAYANVLFLEEMFQSENLRRNVSVGKFKKGRFFFFWGCGKCYLKVSFNNLNIGYLKAQSIIKFNFFM